MAQIVINVPDEKEDRFLNSFAKVFGWDREKNGTKKQFLKMKLKDYMKDIVYRAEIADAHQEASRNLQQELDSIVVD
jgi:hypothetical protein